MEEIVFKAEKNSQDKNSLEKKEKESSIKIMKNSSVTNLYKDNPFASQYYWGMADHERRELYLPDKSDEAISWAMAIHEIGHLVNKGRLDLREMDYKKIEREEERAWSNGRHYLLPYIKKYYGDDEEKVSRLEKILKAVEDRMMKMTRLSKQAYKIEEKNLGKIRENFLKSQDGQKLKKMVDNMEDFVLSKAEKEGGPEFKKQIEWEKFSQIIRRALNDIEQYNVQYESNF